MSSYAEYAYHGVTDNDVSPVSTTRPTDDVATRFLETWYASEINPSRLGDAQDSQEGEVTTIEHPACQISLLDSFTYSQHQTRAARVVER